MNDSQKFYVTTPIYYVTAKPHLGSLYSTLLADVAKRWNKLQGKETFFLTGTDEHGQKIAQAAEKAGKQPQAFVDSFIDAYKKTWHDYEIDYNKFIRTTDADHKEAVKKWIEDLTAKGDIYKATYEGFYCTPCETFVTEKDTVVGSTENPACPSCSRGTVVVAEETYFFKLSAYQDKLLAFYEQNPHFITPIERFQEVISFVKSGLRDLSISRTTISWGIPFPGDDKHVTYVWADALNNYISAIGYGDPQRAAEFAKWWPADLQILGKDIVRFHAVYWPAFLMAAGLPMPHRLLVHGWLKIGDQKMSKSLGNVVDPEKMLEQFGADPVRFYLVRHMAVNQDSPFSIEDLIQRNNSDLADSLGNLLNRLLILAQKNNISSLQFTQPTEAEEVLQKQLDAMLTEFEHEMSNWYFHRAYGAVWSYIHAINAYFHGQEPWKVVKNNPERFAQILAATAESLYAVALLIEPVMPETMHKLLAALGMPFKEGHDYLSELKRNEWNHTFKFQECAPLFTKREMPAEQPIEHVEKDETMSITIDDFIKVELRVGTITEVNEVPKSDKLYRLSVDMGEAEARTVLSGIKKHFTPEQLLNKQAVFVANLQPRPMMGFTSHGMLLTAADAEGKLSFVAPQVAVPNGTQLK